MAQQQQAEKTASEHSGHCICCEVMEHVQDLFGVSPAVRQHLSNSRVELLKALRQVIDDRIEHLSGAKRQGAKITVE